ncbi:MAG: VWA domain-containing protein, partial [bacterium]
MKLFSRHFIFKHKTSFLFILLAFFLFLSPLSTAEEPDSKVILVFDASGSMWESVDEEPKFMIARKVINEMIKEWDPGVHLGLIVYGHRERESCTDIESLIPVSKVNPKKFMKTIKSIDPTGETPLTQAVVEAAKELKYTEEKATVILVSDGKETCNADPCAVSKELEQAGVDFTIHVIGFDLNQEERDALQCLAGNTGGRFFAATDAPALKNALRDTLETVSGDLRPTTEFVAVLSEGSEQQVRENVAWTVRRLTDDGTAEAQPILTVTGIIGTGDLPGGRYLVEAALGNAIGQKTIKVDRKRPVRHKVSLDAAEVTVTALLSPDAAPVPAELLSWSVSGLEPGSKVIESVGANPQTIILSAGSYSLSASGGNTRGEMLAQNITAGQIIDDATINLHAGFAEFTAVHGTAGNDVEGPIDWKISLITDDGVETLIPHAGVANPSRALLAAADYVVMARAGQARGRAKFTIAAGEIVAVPVRLDANNVHLTAVAVTDGPPLPGIEWTVFAENLTGDWNQDLAASASDNPSVLSLSPGRYLARAELGTITGEAEFLVPIDGTTQATVNMDIGFARFTAISSETDKLIVKGVQWHITPVDVDDATPITSGANPSEIFTLATGRYLVRAEAADSSAEVPFEIIAGERIEKNLVLDTQRVHLTAVPEEGQPPLENDVAWGIHMVSADGVVGRDPVATKYGGTVTTFLRPGAYKAVATVGKGRGEKLFQVMPEGTLDVEVVVVIGNLRLTAVATSNGPPIEDLVHWEIFSLGTEGEPESNPIMTSIGNPRAFDLPPGRFLVKAAAGSGRAEVVVDLAANTISERNLVMDVGWVRLKVLPQVGEKPFESASWKVYPVGDGGKPSTDSISHGPYNPQRFTLSAGKYIAEVEVGKGSSKAEFEVKAGEFTEMTVIVGVGDVKLSAIPVEGAKLFGTASWEVYPAGDDDKPASDYISHGYYNPQRFTLPAGKYIAEVEVGQGSARTEFEVKPGEATEVTVIVGVGDVNLSAVPMEGGKLLGGASWEIYPVGDDGNPAKNSISHGYYNPQRFTLPSGKYIAEVEVGEGSARTEFEVKPGEATEVT